MWKWKSLCRFQLFAIPWTMEFIEFSRPAYWREYPFRSPWDFPNPGIKPKFLQCGQILYQLSHKGSPRILEWVAYPFSREFSWPRNWTAVCCIAGEFFASWTTREATVRIKESYHNFQERGGLKKNHWGEWTMNRWEKNMIATHHKNSTNTTI